MRFLENDLIIELNGKRVPVGYLESSKTDFENILGNFKMEDLVCNKTQKEAIEHVVKNGFSSKEEIAEFIKKTKNIEDLNFSINYFENKIEDLNYLLRQKEHNASALDFVNSVNIHYILEKYNEVFFKQYSKLENFKYFFTGSPKDKLPSYIKNVFLNEDGNPLTKDEFSDKLEKLDNFINNYVATSPNRISKKSLFFEKHDYITKTLSESKINFEDTLNIEKYVEPFNNNNEKFYETLEDKIKYLKNQIQEKYLQIEKTNLPQELSDKIKKEVLFAVMAEKKAYSHSGKEFAIRSDFSDIYTATCEMLNVERPRVLNNNKIFPVGNTLSLKM